MSMTEVFDNAVWTKQCPYRIKDANDIGWFNCKLEAGHEATTPHKPPRPLGREPEVVGIWHRPGEKSTADPQPLIPFVVSNEFVAAKSSETGTITPTPPNNS